MSARTWRTENTKPEEPASDHRGTCSAGRPYPDDSSPQIPLAESSRQSLTRCREETHSSRPAGAQARSVRAREDRAHSSRLHHWAEGLIIVHTRPLSETPENPAILVALQCAVSPTLVRPDPLGGDHIATRRTRHEVPRLVGKESRV